MEDLIIFIYEDIEYLALRVRQRYMRDSSSFPCNH